MDRAEVEGNAKVMLHYANGGYVEYASRFPTGPWALASTPVWDFSSYEYRIKKKEEEKRWRCYTRQEFTDLIRANPVWVQKIGSWEVSLITGWDESIDRLTIDGKSYGLPELFANWRWPKTQGPVGILDARNTPEEDG